MRRSIHIVVAALFAFLAVAQAGTQEDPEISDPAGDTAAPQEERDVVAAWIEDDLDTSGDEPAVVFVVQFSDDFQAIPANHVNHERVRFAFLPSNEEAIPEGSAELYVNMRPRLDTDGGEDARCHFGVADEPGSSQDLEEEIALPDGTFEGGILTCVLPVSNLGGFSPATARLTNLYTDFQLVMRGPVTGQGTGDAIPVTVLEDYDRAPDEGFGRPYGAAGAGNGTGNETRNETRFEDVEADLVVSEDGIHESGNILAGDSFVFRFDAAGSFSYHDHVAPNVTGSIDVIGTDGKGNETSNGNETGGEGNGTDGDVNASSDEAGGTLHVVEFVEGDGNDTSTWSFEPAELEIAVGDKVRFVNTGENAHNIMGSFSTSGEAMEHDHDDNGDHMGNETEEADDEESPGVPLLATAGVVALVAVIRRRYAN